MPKTTTWDMSGSWDATGGWATQGRTEEHAPAPGGLSAAGLDRMREVLARPVASGAVPGLVALVGRGDDTHVEVMGTLSAGGDEPMRRDTIFRMASATKPVTAAAAMVLVEECRLRLDDPVDPWLPELADRRVLRSLDAPLDDTVPAHRPITLRDLLTFTFGFGAVLAPPDTYPVQVAIRELGLDTTSPDFGPDEWIRRLGELPLMRQPGEMWQYHTGSDVLGVLIARVAGQPFETFLRERILDPLGMKDTGFHIPEDSIHRLPVCYAHDPATGGLTVWDEAAGGKYSRAPVFAAGGDGLVSTADDYHAFYRMLLGKGTLGGVRVLSRASVELMTGDRLTPAQKTEKDAFGDHFGRHGGYGFGMAVRTHRRDLASPGQFGWDGGLGTSAYADPAEGLVGILLTQTAQDSPDTPGLIRDFWTAAYQTLA
ncbi:serine hydrolase domain-containing protein [Nonomuraea roseoviolacea]|uniref:CubicO group peptidase (Beta-lactamase class C family) n=1 Tax=Nonomuraea roseoviolacea subsp. carminata TaxID=160689 RepID=A0ABT1KAS1_9ACTN|nr:serine hydrolase domain-containing protein [Nonomuraea roseoviolacea]MCP2351122.1 CubicO group peptidase (beta-lactamase class C family) [Nonomuraea roseoviolacea subsp. carminata]